MESFLKRLVDGRTSEEDRKYFLRFGKGNYGGRFLISLTKGSKIKIKSSFELANDFVKLASEIWVVKFSGKILTKDKIDGKEGKKKAGVIVYEIKDEKIDSYKNAYYYLLNAQEGENKLKIKPALPKPGKNEDKVDDTFCLFETELKNWSKIKETFFWDIPEGKKTDISHQIIINEIEMPKNVTDPVKIRELSKRIGKIVRKKVIDGKEETSEHKIS